MLTLRSVLLGGAVLSLGAAMFMGCSGDASAPTDGSQASDDWKAGLEEKVVTALSELTAAERSMALSQKTCPVTDKSLGSMGKPPKVTVEGQEVFLCCSGCEGEIKSNPSEYLSKMNPKR